MYEGAYLSLDRALKEFESREPDRMVAGLLAISLQDLAYDLALQRALDFAADRDEQLRGIGVLCLGHIARVYGRLDLDAADAAVRAGLTDESDFVRGHAESARDDVIQFLRPASFAGALRTQPVGAR